MKKAIGLIFTIVIIASCFLLFYYKKLFSIDMNGYILDSSEVSTNLHNSSLTEKEAGLNLVSVTEYDNVYIQGNKYYIGEDKKQKIDITYPVISNDGARVLNLSSDNRIINSSYEEQSLYKDAIIASGEIYNKMDNERIDEELYYFIKLKDNLYMNTLSMKITKENKEVIIPVNSILYFDENEIRYYEYQDSNYYYKNVGGLDNSTIITFKEESINYQQLRINLNLEAATEPKEEPIIPEEPTPEPEPENPTPGKDPIETTPPEKIYVKPEVSAKNLTASVYSMKIDLTIKDSAARIKKNPSFEIFVDGKTFIKKSFNSSGSKEIVGLLPDGDYTIVGSYTYLNENDVEIKNTFYEGSFKTKNINELETLLLSYENVTASSNSISLKNMVFQNNSDSEVLKGIKKMTVEIDGKTFNASSSIINSLKKLVKVDYETPTVLKSNTSYKLQLKFYDVSDNELKVENAFISARTSKKVPSVSIEINNTDLTTFTATVKIDNPDNVALNNLRYVVKKNTGEIITEDKLITEIIKVENLDSNEVYSFSIYADYDLENGEGNQTNQKLKEVKVSTLPIASLGFLRLNFQNTNLSDKAASFKMNININSTDQRLVSLLSGLNISIYEKDGDTFVKKIVLSEVETETLKNGGEIPILINNLYSKTDYTMKIESSFKQGEKEYIITALTNLNEFKTLKKAARVEVINKFSTSSLIDFDVKIEDIDLAIESNRVLLEIRNSADALVAMEEIAVNSDYTRFTFNKLNKEEAYTFKYIVEEYNEGYNNISYEENKTLFEEQIITKEGIIGSLSIDSLLKQTISKNLYDINNTQRWKSTAGTSTLTEKKYDFSENVVFLSAQNGYRNYAYYLPELRNQKITVSFLAKYDKSEIYKPVYVANGDGNNRNYELKDLSDTEWKRYTYSLTLNNLGYLGFIVDEQERNNTTTIVGIKDLQIELGTSATDYTPYEEKEKFMASILVNLDDTRNEITTDDYYINIYKNDELIDTVHYEIENQTKVTDYLVNYEVEKDANYKIALAVKIRDRFYEINTLLFTTEEEIRTIKTIDDFFKVHTNGKYLVANDLDFRNTGSSLGTPFSGSIDFQGHKVLIDLDGSSSRLIYMVESDGRLSNLDVHYYFNNKTARNDFYGLVYHLKGTITNLKITIEESTEVANSVISLISYVNRGTVENFAIYAKAPLYGRRWVTYGNLHNYGIMRNGYVYGEPIRAIYPTNVNEPKRMGALAGYTAENSQIENVYSLIDIDVMESTSVDITDNDLLVGNIVGQNSRGVLTNVYSYASGKNRDLTLDPNIGNTRGNITVNATNLYYASEEMYADKYSLKISKMALKDEEFQNKILNNMNQFNVSDYVKYGYYPHLNWPEVMPNQEYVKLPEVKDEDLIDITSVDSIKQNGAKATVILNVSNPSNEKIIDLQIKNLTTRIVSQETSRGKTKLTIEVSNPDKYISKYYMKSITSVGAFNISYTRKYQDTERVLQMDLYKTVSSIADWQKIKSSPSENYMLATDLDFKNATSQMIQIGNFSGILNGDGHTIKNIEITTGGAVIGTLTGTVKNLFVENYQKSNRTAYAGLVDYASTNSELNNVHMKNVKVIGNSHIGGLVGYANGSIIRNCSVVGLTLFDTSNLVDARVGGLVGYVVSSIITNSFVQDVNYDLRNATLIYASGGLIGDLGSGNVENVYATGTIYTSSQESGGLVGRNNGTISKAYTNFNIYSQNDYVGGIVGNTLTDYVSNTLVVGSIYSSADVNNIGRIIGNKGLDQSNYAWTNQHINGLASMNVNEERLLSTEDLNNLLAYERYLGFGTAFDFSGIGDNSLPLLRNSETNEILPNQAKTYLKQFSFEVKNITIDKQISNAYILLTIDNPMNYEIKNIVIEDLNITKVRKNITENGVTTYEVEVTPEKYFDSYRLTDIVYIENGQEKTYVQEARIPLQFYKDIEKYEDWQKISSNSFENYRLVADIDFSGKTNINHNIVFNRLEGTEDGHTLKNMELNFNKDGEALIESIKNKISNIKFENIKISNTSSSNRTGIIRYTFGEISKLSFLDITINAPNMSYVGVIAEDRSLDIRNIALENITVTGKQYVGSFISKTRYYALTNVDLKNITVTGKGNYVGGMIGVSDYINQSLHYNITADNITVTNTGNYTGGIYGYGAGSYITLTNSYVKGASYVGGIMGEQRSGYSYYLRVEDSEIIGSGTNIGGIFGWNRQIEHAIVRNTTITGTSTSTTNVGGVSGTGDWTMLYVHIYDSKINSLGSFVGGIKGRSNNGSIDRCATTNITVTGNSYVGGILGGHYNTTTQVRNSTTNAIVTATYQGAGGIIGYISNATTDDASNRMYIYNTIVEDSTINSRYEAGGLIGKVDKQLFTGRYYNNLIAATIITTEDVSLPNAVVGSGDFYAANINNLRIYANTKLIHKDTTTTAYDAAHEGINSNAYITYNQLKTQSTYTNIGLSTSYFDYSKLSSSYFPFLKAIQPAYMKYTSLPSENALRASLMSNNLLRLYSGLMTSHEMPKYKIYTSGINTINIEFDKVDPYTKFTVNNEVYDINKRVFTFQYNFIDDITFSITDGLNKKEEHITPAGVRKNALVYQNKYYIIKDNQFLTNDANIKQTVVNMYDKYLLLKDGSIYDAEKTSFTEPAEIIVSLYSKDIPLYEFTYDNHKIETYYSFSIIDNDIMFEKQILLKNEQIEILSKSLESKKNQILLDNYNNKNYLTILGDDGVIYNLKEKITFPDNFKNKKIKEISDNVLVDTKLVIVLYENGDIICFNYHNGNVVYKDIAKSNTNIIEYFIESIGINNESLLPNDLEKSYQESEKIIEKITNEPIEKVQSGTEQTSEKKYIQVYDPLKKEYEIYDIKTLVNPKESSLPTEDKTQSVTDLIYSNNKLSNYYLKDQSTGEIVTIFNRVIIFIGILIAIILAVIALANTLKKKKPVKQI